LDLPSFFFENLLPIDALFYFIFVECGIDSFSFEKIIRLNNHRFSFRSFLGFDLNQKMSDSHDPNGSMSLTKEERNG